MKSLIYGLMIVTAIALCACITYPVMSTVCVDDAMIYKGQSADSVVDLLGPPDIVSSGGWLFCKHATDFGLNPSRNAIEWVFLGPQTSTVVYLHFGRVAAIGQLPTEKVRR